MLSSRSSTRRYGAVLLVFTLAAALPVGACGAASEGNSLGPTTGYDSGTGSDSGAASDATTDGPPTDTGATDGAIAPTTALFVQASPSLPDVRLCWAVNGVVAPVLPFPGDGAMPGSNYPGVPLGGVAPMSDASPLVGGGVTLYALDAENLARIEQGQSAPSTCDALVCGQGSNLKPPCLRYNFDYWPVGAITAGGVVAGRDNVVALSGCLPTALDPNASTVLCGSSWNAGNGNLHADVLQLQPTTSLGLVWSVQAAQLSPAMAALEGDGGTALVSFGAEDAAADAAVEVAILRGEGDLSLQTAVTFEAGLPGYGQLGFAVDVAGSDGGAGHLWMSLADSQQLVDPTVDPTQFFGQPRAYLVAVLGDPNAPHAFAPVTGDAGYDGRGLHVLVVAAPLPGTPDAGIGEAAAGEAGDAGDGGAGDP
jgi:hypothetical protein